MNEHNSLELYVLSIFTKSLSLICALVGLACLLSDLILGDITLLRFTCWVLGSSIAMSVFFWISDMECVDDEW